MSTPPASPHTRPIDALLLDRYLAGSASDTERRVVEAWRDESALHGALIEIARSGRRDGQLVAVDVERALQRLWQGERGAEDAARRGAEVVGGRARRHGTVSGGRFSGVHPRMLGGGIAGLGSQLLRGRLVLGALTLVCAFVVSWAVSEARRQPHASETEVAHTAATQAGQCATVRLADGSRVMLAPRTTITIPADFGVKARLVSITGEAYFVVATDNRTPFVVRAGNTRTDVLGTAFVVRRYANDSYTQVAVTAGRVSVAAVTGRGAAIHRPTVVLAAGMVGQVTDSTATASTATDMDEQVGWTDGRLVFHNTPVPRALATIERWYGYQFQLADSGLVVGKLTVVFDPNNAADMLRTLEALLDVTMTFDGPVITLHPRRAAGGHIRHDVQDSLSHASRMEVGR